MMNNQEAEQLIIKFLKGQCTAEERQLVIEWYRQNELDQTEPPAKDYSEMKSLILKEVLSTPQPGSFKLKNIWYKMAAAAVVLIVMGLMTYINWSYDHNSTVSFTKDVSPGKKSAVLTTPEGKEVDLADVLVYESSNAKNYSNSNAGDNIIKTPVGGTFSLVLPDGTKVWLNAASSIKFPVKFEEAERTVTLTGEGYFEVSKNKDKPFKVYVGNQVVKVLGTHFNINSYIDEEVTKTTLLEGQIAVSTGVSKVIVNPGQQAILKPNGQLLVNHIDANGEVAWKAGVFDFKTADIKFILRQFSRWYNIEVVYRGSVSTDLFSGKIRKDLNLSDALKILSIQDVHFKIDGNQLIVTP